MRFGTVTEIKAPTRVGIIGDPKKGKTRFATSLPWGPIWGEKAAYVAWDPGSALLESVTDEDRKRLIVIEPQPKEVKNKKTGLLELAFDPLEEAISIAKYPWQKEGCGTLIWDTMTSTSEQLLMAIASATTTVDKAGDQPSSIGVAGTDSYVAQPMLNDFGTAQRSTIHIINRLFLQPINVIVIFQPIEDDNDGKSKLVGGPASVGKAAIRSIASMFNNLFRVDVVRLRKKGVMPPQYEDPKRVVLTEGLDHWLLGIRVKGQNPIPEFPIDGDGGRQFWNEFDKARGA